MVHSVEMLYIRYMLNIVDMVGMMDMMDTVISLQLGLRIRRQIHEKFVYIFPWILVKYFQRFVFNPFANNRIIIQKENACLQLRNVSTRQKKNN